MPYCPNCGEQVREGDSFCYECGTGVERRNADSGESTDSVDDEEQPAAESADVEKAEEPPETQPQEKGYGSNWLYWLAFFGCFFWINVTAFSLYLGSVGNGVITGIVWIGFGLVAIPSYVDLRRVKTETDVDFLTPKELLFSLAIPYVNILGGLNYLYSRHKNLNAIPKSGWLSHSVCLVSSALFMSIALWLVPIVFGPIGIIFGVKVLKDYSNIQGAILIVGNLFATFAGFALGVLTFYL